jgi:hypothetical protein
MTQLLKRCLVDKGKYRTVRAKCFSFFIGHTTVHTLLISID